MISKWQWLWQQLTEKLWLRASLFALVGIAAALLAVVTQQMFPSNWALSIGAEAVEPVLKIIASSMLAVTTFSLSVMVTAYQAASTSVTPRATQVLLQDQTSQNVLGTFIGAFLYALVAIIALSTDAYDRNGRLLLFIVTLLVIVLVVMALLRWIAHLTQFGRVGDTCDRVEAVAQLAINRHLKAPCLGGICASHQKVDQVDTVLAGQFGYIQHIDILCLQGIAERCGGLLRLTAISGKYVSHDTQLLWSNVALSTELKTEILQAYTIAHQRNFAQDPRFGVIVLTEIASRALSPAVNDPGTAIEVIGRQVRLLSSFRAESGAIERTKSCARVIVPELLIDDLLRDAFAPIVRDAGNNVEVRIRLQKALADLSQYMDVTWHEPIAQQQRYALNFAQQTLNEDDLKRLQES